MISKFYLKNIGKYNDIKLAKGLDLQVFKTTPRKKTTKFDTGVSTVEFGDRWFVLPDGKALFKTYKGYGEIIRNIRIYNEMLCGILCRQIGIDCATYAPAYFKEQDGLITYNVAKDGDELMNLACFKNIDYSFGPNLVDCAEAIDCYIKNGYKINKKQMLIDLYKISVFDFLTLQTDRNSGNVNFLYNSEDKSLKVAPLFDNEFSFGGQSLMQLYKINYNSGVKYTPSSDELFEDLNAHSKMFTIESDNYTYKFRIPLNVRNITLYAKKYPTFKNVLDKMINNIDINSAISELKDRGYEIPEEYERYLIELIDYTTSFIKDTKRQRVSHEEIEDINEIM